MARQLDVPGLKALGLSPSDIARWDTNSGGGGGSGDVTGPSSATDGHLAVFDGTDGKKIKDGGEVPSGGGGITVWDSGVTYSMGALVLDRGSIWKSANENTDSQPTITNTDWEHVSGLVDLGLVKVSDAVIYGRSRPLIPYADGRLIKSVKFVPGGAIPTSSGDNFAFNTPNTSAANAGDGIAILGYALDTSTWGTDGYQNRSQAVSLDGSGGNTTGILDCGPLIAFAGSVIGLNLGQPLGAWQADTPVCLGDAILDVNNHVQYVTTNGVTGSELPTFDTSGGTTNDGSAVWTDLGLVETGQVHAIAEVIEGVSLMPPYPATCEWITPPSDTIAGDTIPDFSAIFKDQFGNPYTFVAAGFFVNIAILGAGTLNFPTAQSDGNTGIVTFSGFSITEPGNGYVLRVMMAPAVTCDPIFSPPFNVTKFDITGINQGTKTITVSGDAGALSGTIQVKGSTGNDGFYTVVSAIFAAGHTAIVVVEAIPDATSDGWVQK